MTETLEVALCQELNDKLKRIAELEEALRPFADVAREPRETNTALIGWGDFLRARKVVDHE